MRPRPYVNPLDESQSVWMLVAMALSIAAGIALVAWSFAP